MPQSRHHLILALCGAIVATPGTAFAQAATGLPGGATSLSETHGDWIVNCAVQSQGGHNAKRCAFSQEQTDTKTHQRLIAVELKPENNGVTGVLVLPFGLALERGAAFQIDDGPAGPPQRFRTCLPVGCLVPVSFDARTLAALRKGAQLKVKTVADDGKEAAFMISLKGFPSAFDRTVALAK